MTDIEAIRQREAEHQREHDLHHTESCLPAGCSPDEGDIPVLLREVDRLRGENGILEKQNHEKGEWLNQLLKKAPTRHPGLGDPVLCSSIDAVGQIGAGRASVEAYHQSEHPNRTDALALKPFHPGTPLVRRSDGSLAEATEIVCEGLEVRAEWTEPEIRALATEENINLTDCTIGGSYSSGGISREQMIERLRVLAAIPPGTSKPSRAGRPRNCPNTKTCKGRLRSDEDKAVGLCGKCRKARVTSASESS